MSDIVESVRMRLFDLQDLDYKAFHCKLMLIGQLRVAPPSHPAGAGVPDRIPPVDAVGPQALGQHAHVKGRVVGYQQAAGQDGLQGRPELPEVGRGFRHGRGPASAGG